MTAFLYHKSLIIVPIARQFRPRRQVWNQSRLLGEGDLVDDVVAATLDVVDPDPQIFPQPGSLDGLTIGSNVGYVPSENEVDGFSGAGVEHERGVRSVFGDRACTFH